MTADIDGPAPRRALAGRLLLWRDALLGRIAGGEDDYPAEGVLERPERSSRLKWLLSRPWHRLEAPIVALIIMGSIALAAVFISLQAALPKQDQVTALLSQRTIHYLDTEGGLLGREGAPRPNIAHLRAANPNIINAVVAIEDRSFFHNDGVDLMALGRIVKDAFRKGGGSTLSMQLAKNVYQLDKEATWIDEAPAEEPPAKTGKGAKPAKPAKPAKAAKTDKPFRIQTPLVCKVSRKACRKIYEIDLAYKFTRENTKDQLLAVYFQVVQPHPGKPGIESAARLWFGKELDQLSIAQAARVAAALKGKCYSPMGIHYDACDPDKPRARAAAVIRAMRDQGMIDKAQEEAALVENRAMVVTPSESTGSVVARWLHRYARAGLPQDGDLTVRTTLDPRLMKAARAALESAPPNVQAALVALDPRTGAVRAMIPGRESTASFNLAVEGRRPAGSVLKPLLYTAALEAGATPGSLCDDAPYPGGPRNAYKDAPRRIPLWEALQKSSNRVTIRLGEQVGADAMNNVAERVGMRFIGAGQSTHPFPSGDRLAWIGEGAQANIRLLDIAAAYAPFANGGLAVAPYGVAGYVDSQGQTATTAPQAPVRAIDPRIAGEMRAMLRRVVTDGTGVEADVPGLEIAGKTGTTNKAADGWFVGFHDDLVVAVWLGQELAPGKDATFQPVSGHTAAAVVHKFLVEARQGQPAPPTAKVAAPRFWPNGPVVALRPGALSCDAGL